MGVSQLRNSAAYWDQLSKLLQGLPARHMVVLGMDVNTQLQPVNGHIGRGTLRTHQQRDPDFEAVVTAQKLVILNSWGSSASGASHTFCHETFDLAPWRQGPKHRAVVALIPWRAGWTFGVRKPAKYSVFCLRQSIKDCDARSQELRWHILQALADTDTVLGIEPLNAKLLDKCETLYPCQRRHNDKPSTRPEVVQKVADMWKAHRQLGRSWLPPSTSVV